MNTYAAYHVMYGGVDPSGSVVIFVHGINTENIGDIKEVYSELKNTWGKDKDQALIHFRYSRFGKRPDELDAAGGLIGPADYSGDLNQKAGRALAGLIRHLKKERSRIVKKHGKKCWEPINILAYSNGSNVAYHALFTYKQSVDNLVFIGASIDDRASISEKLGDQSGAFHNYGSYTDTVAGLVDGLGHEGIKPSVASSRPDIHNHRIGHVQHSVGSHGVSASDTSPARIQVQTGHARIETFPRTAWLTRFMARTHYAGKLQHEGFPGLSTYGTLPQGTKLQPSRAFNYSVDMKRATIGHGGGDLGTPVEGTYTGNGW